MTVLNVHRLLVRWCEWSAWWSERSATDRVEHRLSEEGEGKEEAGKGEEEEEEEEEYNEEEEDEEEEDNEVLDGMDESPVIFFKSNALPFSNSWATFSTFCFRLSESATQMRFASK